MEPIRLPKNFETYHPEQYRGAVCEQCGRPLEVVHDYKESDWPYRFKCTPCTDRAIAESKAYMEPIRRFEKDGLMLRWWMNNKPRYEPDARIRYIGLVMQYLGTPEEYAIYESRYRM